MRRRAFLGLGASGGALALAGYLSSFDGRSPSATANASSDTDGPPGDAAHQPTKPATSGDTLALSVPTPQVARHEGYEAAFLDMASTELTV